MLVLASVAHAKEPSKAARHRDYVPDEKTAIRIAEAVLEGQFGEKRAKQQEPYWAESVDDIWRVQGTLHGIQGPGGNFAVYIKKYSGCVGVIEHMK